MNNKEYTPDNRGLIPNKYRVFDESMTKVEWPYFVLRPKDPHARKALLTYAESIENENPILSNEIRELVVKYVEEEKK